MKSRPFLNFFLVAAALMCLNYSVQGQFLDTLKVSFHKPPKFFGTVSFSKTFGVNRGADIIAFRLGTAQNQRIYYGLGYYILNTDVVKNITVPINGVDVIKPAKLKLRFVTVNAEYIYYRDDHWQFGVPANIGYGKSYFEYLKAYSEKAKTTKTGSMFLTFGVAGHYKFIPWVGLGFGLGHTTTLGTNKKGDQNFTAWTYSFGVKLFFDEIYRTVRDLKKSKKEKSEPSNSDEGPVPDFKN